MAKLEDKLKSWICRPRHHVNDTPFGRAGLHRLGCCRLQLFSMISFHPLVDFSFPNLSTILKFVYCSSHPPKLYTSPSSQCSRRLRSWPHATTRWSVIDAPASSALPPPLRRRPSRHRLREECASPLDEVQHSVIPISIFRYSNY